MTNYVSMMLLSDGYKQSHAPQYPKGTEFVESNWTPRSNKHAKTKDGVVCFSIEAFFQDLRDSFKKNFFSRNLEVVLVEFSYRYKAYFGVDYCDTSRIADLWSLQYLPIEVKALPEGSMCPIGVPMMTIRNTHEDFYWLPNFLETILSSNLWGPMTSATIARGYKQILLNWSEKTCDNNDHVMFQAHDFSMRGMLGDAAAAACGAGHLLSFYGTDTIPALGWLDRFHPTSAESIIGCSVPATEHSVMSMGTKDDEIGTFKRLITEIYPKGIVSIVSDTWDLWKVLTEYLPALKDEVMARDGKVVIRPDSGDPVDIICGMNQYDIDKGINYSHKHPSYKGVIELLWETFGGTVNSKGYKVLDSHIGAIYGDSITLERAEDICARLEAKGFASSNIVFGVGSYTYQYNTRDTYGFAMKATHGVVNGEGRDIFKDPITDDGTKKSLKGRVRVEMEDGKYVVYDQQTDAQAKEGALETVFVDGVMKRTTSLTKMRERVEKSL